MSFACTVCCAPNVDIGLSFGKQPPSNRFLSKVDDSEERYSLGLGSCKHCGTIQLTERMPIEVVRPRFEWLVYNEPEGHLDDVIAKLSKLPGIKKNSRFMGVTYKDQSSLNRLAKLGYSNIRCIEDTDLQLTVIPFGLESIQHALSNDLVISRLHKQHGQADVLLVRHIVEHAENANRFIRSLRHLITPGGYMIFELPDSERIFRSGNHAFVWEEHLTYFTEQTIYSLAEAVDAEVVWFNRYPYAYEDSLVVALQFRELSSAQKAHKYNKIEDPAKVIHAFAIRLEDERVRWRNNLREMRRQGKKLAVFGAGHLAAKFINFLGLAEFIDCVIDDHPQKLGLLMPGSQLPIRHSSELHAADIQFCISTLSPESEAKVRIKLQNYFAAGGMFLAAFTSGA